MYELIYTSTPQGLITGRSGFTTVALTEGFPPNLIAPVENFSGYKTLFSPGNANENHNPVNFSCQHFHLGRTPYIVLSRIAFAGLSYTGRSNVLAHHLLFQPDELDDIPGGAVSILRAQENFPPWSGDARMLPPKREIEAVPLPEKSSMWQKLAGDGRWAQYTAEAFSTRPEKSLALAFDPLQVQGSDILELIAETASYLSTEELRRFTFSTYCYSSGVSSPLFFRSYVNDSAQLGSIRRLDPGSVITLGMDNPLPATWSEKKSVPEVITLQVPEEKLSVEQQGVSAAEKARKGSQRRQQSSVLDLHQGAASEKPLSYSARNGSASASKAGAAGEEREGNGKWIIVFLLICAVIGLLTVFIVRIFFTEGDSKATLPPLEEDGSPRAVAKVETKKGADLPKGGTKKTPAVSQGKGVPAAKKAAPEEKKTGKKVPPSAKSSPAVKKKTAKPLKPVTRTALVFGQLTEKQEFEVYRSFYQGKAFMLPESLQDTAALELQIHSVGGAGDVGDLKRFVSGNKTAAVSVCSKREHNTGLLREWEADPDPAGKLTFKLVPGGRLSITPARKISDNSPQLSDVTRLTFISRRGQRYDLVPRKLPRSVFHILNSRKKLIFHRSETKISCFMQFSEALWIFRKFCTVRINGRDFGGEVIVRDRQDILVQELDLKLIMRMTEKRNLSLVKYKEDESSLARHKNIYREKLTLCQTLLKTLCKEKPVYKGNLKLLHSALLSDEKEKAQKCMDFFADKFIAEKKLLKLPEDSETAFEKKLNSLREKTIDSVEAAGEFQKCQEQREKSFQEFCRINESLSNALKNLSPAIHRVCSKKLVADGTPQTISPDFYSQVSRAELLKDIKVEIIRKERP